MGSWLSWCAEYGLLGHIGKGRSRLISRRRWRQDDPLESCCVEELGTGLIRIYDNKVSSRYVAVLIAATYADDTSDTRSCPAASLLDSAGERCVCIPQQL